MADLRPDDPRGLLETAADNTGSFSDVRPDIFPDEIPGGDLPTWGLDPREQELDHEATGGGGRIYSGVAIEHIVYVAVQSGPDARDRAGARQDLKTLRGEYLTEMFNVFANETTDGSAQKTGRNQFDIRQGESMLLVDAISIQVRQIQIYK
jgi:hypothetical protein